MRDAGREVIEKAVSPRWTDRAARWPAVGPGSVLAGRRPNVEKFYNYGSQPRIKPREAIVFFMNMMECTIIALSVSGHIPHISAKEMTMNRSGRMVLGAIVAAMGLAVGISGPAHAQLVTNGSFETGDFTGWTQFGNTGFTGVDGNPGPGDGLQAAFFGPVGSNGGITQTLNTLPGRFYNINFDFQPDGGVTSFFSAVWDAQPALFSVTNPAASPYQLLHFTALATTPTTSLTFTFRDDPGFLFLDSVSVAVPEPGSLALLGIGMAGLWWRRRKV